MKKVEESSCAVSVNEQVNVRDIDEQQKSTNLHFEQRTLDYRTYWITFVQDVSQARRESETETERRK